MKETRLSKECKTKKGFTFDFEFTTKHYIELFLTLIIIGLVIYFRQIYGVTHIVEVCNGQPYIIDTFQTIKGGLIG